VACDISLESSRQGLQVFFRLHFNRRSIHKVMGPQSYGRPNFGNFGIPTWESREKNDIWVVVPWLGIEYTIRGKVVASPKSGLWWVLWIQICMWFIRAPKCYNYALINLLFGLYKSMWINEVLVNLPSFIPKLQHTLLPPKCCEPGDVPELLFLPLSSPLDS